MAERRYRRIMLKLSGQSLQGDAEFGIDHTVLDASAQVTTLITKKA